MKEDIKDILVTPNTKIKDVIKIIDEGVKQIALVVDRKHKLLGTITDGDVRRGIINGIDLDDQANKIMNREFISLSLDVTKDEMIKTFKNKSVNQIPLLNQEGQVKKIVLINDIIKDEKKDNYVVLMVGGLGTRLRPLTEDTPKPLLEVGDKPILEIIVEQFKEHGFYKFIFCVNYEAQQIKEYFGDGGTWNVKIEYVKENKRLGTAGPLGLIEKKIKEPFIVMNGDLLTKLNFDSLLKYHNKGDYILTIGSREYSYQVPYGVLNIEGNQVKKVVEKPNHSFFVNAGVYVLDPKLMKLIPHNQFYDMTDLIDELIEADEKIGSFPIREYWLDIGQHADYKKANDEYWDYFSQVSATK